MGSEEQPLNHFMPGKDLLDICGQAMQFGYVFPVFVTKQVWGECITWTPKIGKHSEVTAEKRIYELLQSCYSGMGKALASNPDRVFYEFKHWFWPRMRPKAKKQCKMEFGARLLLYPETEEPWLLIFDPARDGEEVLDRGESTENREIVGDTGAMGVGDSPDLDDGNSKSSGNKNNKPYLRSVT